MNKSSNITDKENKTLSADESGKSIPSDPDTTLGNTSDQGNSRDTINVKTKNTDKTKHSGVAKEVTDPTKTDKAAKTNIMKLKEKTKGKKANQPKMKAIYEKKKPSKERRKIAMAER